MMLEPESTDNNLTSIEGVLEIESDNLNKINPENNYNHDENKNQENENEDELDSEMIERNEEKEKKSFVEKVVGCLKKYWKGLLAIILLWSVGIIISAFFRDEVQSAIDWFAENNTLGVILYSITFIIAVQVGMPSTIMEIGAAFIVGSFGEIFLLNTVAGNLTNILGFFIGKYLIYNWVERNLLDSENTVSRALKKMISKYPVRYATLWGFAYVPNWSKNYGLPVLGCPFWAFLLACNISGLPYTTLWTLIGMQTRDTIKDVKAGKSVDKLQLIGVIIGVVGLIVMLVAIGIVVRKEMKKIKELEESGQLPEPVVQEENLRHYV